MKNKSIGDIKKVAAVVAKHIKEISGGRVDPMIVESEFGVEVLFDPDKVGQNVDEVIDSAEDLLSAY